MGNWISALGEQLGTQAASTGLGTIMGLALEGHNDRRQLRQQERLQNLQMSGNKQMIDYQKMKDLEMWKETGPTGMTKQLKEAGLNPALMYGMSGGGGTTTGGSGSVSGANAPQGGKEIIESMGMSMQGAQLQLLNAQRKNIEADTANKQATTTKTAGVDTQKTETEIESLTQGIQSSIAAQKYTEAQTIMQDIQNEIQGAEQNDLKALIRYGVRELYAKMKSAEIQQHVDEKTQEIKIKQAQATLALTIVDKWLKGAQMTGIKQDVIESAFRVRHAIQENMRKWKQLGQTDTGQRMEQERIDYDTSVPPELKELLDMIYLVPGGGAKKVNPVGFKIK